MAEAGEGAAVALDALRQVFRERFRRDPEVGARAPGRVNLIGEHTDYNEGLVLPCAIDLDALALAARRRDGRVRIWSSNLREEQSFELDGAAPRPGWTGYAQAVLLVLHERGLRFSGFDLAVASRVPLGAGLSSSAALGVSLAAAVCLAAGRAFDPRFLADVAHRAESEVLGVGSGILDPYASALGRRDEVLRIDCRSKQVRFVPMPAGSARLLVSDSGVRRALAERGSGYRVRVAECAAALHEARGWLAHTEGHWQSRGRRLRAGR